MGKHLLVISAFLIYYSTSLAFGQIPVGYYDQANGKSGAELKTVLHAIIHNFISPDYDGFTAMYWGNNYFTKTDWNSGGYFWDMYSSQHRTAYNSSTMSREHCMPRSWWGNTGDYGTANSDLHNLFPSDYTANSKKSNLPLGEVGVASWTNDVVKIGSNTFSGYSGTVFEPADEYKGDFARTYFYMVTCHQDYADRWKSEGINTMLNNNTYPVFQDWAIDMLLKWSRQDPVSQKEIDRNNAVFGIQQNRNPFVDFPELYEYIWGDKRSEDFAVNAQATSPTLVTPVDGTSINFGTVKTTAQKTCVVPVRGAMLPSDLTLEWVDNVSEYFSIPSFSISSADANQQGGVLLNVLYNPLAAGSHSAKLRIRNIASGIASVVNMQGTAAQSLGIDPVTPDEDMDVMFFYQGPWNPSFLPSNFATNVSADPYSNGDFKFSKTKDYLTVSFDESPDIMRFAIYPRNAWAANANHLYVYEGISVSAIGTTPIADFDNEFMSVGDSYNNTPAISLKENTRAIKIEYIKVAQNAGINNLFVTRRAISGIENGAIENLVRIHAAKGRIYVEGAVVGQVLVVYDLLGRVLYQKTITDSESIVSFPYSGLFVVRVGDLMKKVII